MNIMADKELIIPFSLVSRPKTNLGSSLSTTIVHCTSPSPQGYYHSLLSTWLFLYIHNCGSFCAQQPKWASAISISPPSPTYTHQWLIVKSRLLAEDHYQVGGLFWPATPISTHTLSPHSRSHQPPPHSSHLPNMTLPQDSRTFCPISFLLVLHATGFVISKDSAQCSERPSRLLLPGCLSFHPTLFTV